MSKYTLESKPFSALPSFHQGAGNISNSAHVVDPPSVNQDVNSALRFKFAPFNITVMSVEIATNDAPNWFGVSFRRNIKVFDTVNIFCHPHPGNAGMRDADYANRSGEWPKLFRYAQNFGRQMDIAQSNHITIIPFFNNASYNSTGIFGPNWKDIVEQILRLARTGAMAAQTPGGKTRWADTPIESVKYAGSGKKGSPAEVHTLGLLRNVVLSDFSHGRQLMWTVRQQSPGLSGFLREVWDFDGVHGAVPVSPRAIVYDQGSGAAASHTTFHVPGERWQEYHHAILNREQLHGDLPAMLACHAASISSVGN
jgi:hypothetical protein